MWDVQVRHSWRNGNNIGGVVFLRRNTVCHQRVQHWPTKQVTSIRPCPDSDLPPPFLRHRWSTVNLEVHTETEGLSTLGKKNVTYVLYIFLWDQRSTQKHLSSGVKSWWSLRTSHVYSVEIVNIIVDKVKYSGTIPTLSEFS